MSERPPPHSSTIHPDIAPKLFKNFEQLSKDSLVEECVLGVTQNESFNSTIWQWCLNTEFALQPQWR